MSDPIGKTISGYQLIEVIDESGTALVYRGFQPSMNRYVAVKVLKPGAARDPASVHRFLQSAELAAGMQHANILPIYEAKQAEGMVYRVSPYIENGALRDHLSWFYDQSNALGLINELVAALEYIHGQGYVHGNIKPTNILIDDQRRPLLADFGFAQQPGATPTPYMSPEQVQGGVVDRRSDIYALGVLLYEILVGAAPPAGAVVSPRARRPDLPQAVEMVVFKAMAQNPDERFQSAGEFRGALEAAFRAPAPPPQPVPAQAPTPVAAPAPPPPTKKGTNWLAILLGGLLIIILCACAVFLIPRVMDYIAEGSPTQGPPEVTVVLPTREPRPTREPKPTEPPIEPTQPPIEPPPTEQPPVEPPPSEEPPIEPPPGEQPPEEQPPGEQPPGEGPPQEGGGNPIDQLCGSSASLMGGALALAGVIAFRKRWNSQ